MKAVIVNCFDTYEERVDLVHEFLKEYGCDVIVIQSDFRHFKKVHRKDIKEGFRFIRSKPYYKNLSIARLSSHYLYASDAFKIVEEIKPDLIYTFIPPNSLAHFAAKYKQKYKEVKLILDLIDLWPETMPIGKVKKIPPFTLWGIMRDRSLKYADLVITECDLYKTVLSESLKGVNTETLYLAKKEINVIRNPQLNENEIHLSYLGSINNIIDISKIKEIIETINDIKPVTLHIIGDGESRQELIDVAKVGGANVEYYGKIYDPQQKQDIFDKCHFGLNIMKDSVCVGLTMKSIDYFQFGLPIISNIQADTVKIIEKNDVGFNVIGENNREVAIKVANVEKTELLKMRENAYAIFEDMFSEKEFMAKLKTTIMKLYNLGE